MNPMSVASVTASGFVPANYPAHDQNDCAEAVVEYLLRETDLAQLVEGDSLIVTVGSGDWISWSFHLHSAISDPANTISKLWNAAGRRSFRRCWNRAGNSSWFRGKGAPSLHFEVRYRSHSRCGHVIKGHVDAADPWSHPVQHLLADYLPAHGVGKHPAPGLILARIRKVHG
ncbi:MAG: hypothetical protein WA211_00425 [Candidatus Acidiferrales bacterium]